VRACVRARARVCVCVCFGAGQTCGPRESRRTYESCPARLAIVGSVCDSEFGLRHSIAFTTLRPGGYDVLLESLARQTSKDFELICIDTLADKRAHLIRARPVSSARPATTALSNCAACCPGPWLS
jgi:hypothetical protein